MTQTDDLKQSYLATFADFERNLNGHSSSQVHALRKDAIKEFDQLGFPTTQDEAWKSINLGDLTKVQFAPVTEYQPGTVDSKKIQEFKFSGDMAAHLVFVDGIYADDLSDTESLPGDIRAGSLAGFLESDNELVSQHLGRHVSYKDQPFTALNTAFIQDGAFVHIPKNVVQEGTIHLLFLSTESDVPTVSHPRTLILAGSNSQCSITETYAGLGEGAYFTNAVTEIVAQDHAIVEHYCIEVESPGSYHTANHQSSLGKASVVTSHAFTLGGGFVRNDISARLEGEGCEATLNGFYLLEDGQHVDNYTLLEHVAPNCPSHELYKGILGGASRAIFRGKIHVHKEAQKTDAYQSNQNLLLSENSRVNTKPQLEIYADEVKCSHGATVGQMDQNALFYLKSRGISDALAHHMLLQAFGGELVNLVKVESLRNQLEKWILRKIEKIQSSGTLR